MSYHLAPDAYCGDTLWRHTDHADPTPVACRHELSEEHWRLLLRGAGLDPDTVCVSREDLSTLLCHPLRAILPAYARDAAQRLTETLNDVEATR